MSVDGGDPDAAPTTTGPSELDRQPQLFDDAFGDRDGALSRGLGTEQDELITARTGKGVGGTGHRFQPRRQLTEDEIAREVTVGVVDFFETVEVDQQ